MADGIVTGAIHGAVEGVVEKSYEAGAHAVDEGLATPPPLERR
jgi:hypothetical protein